MLSIGETRALPIGIARRPQRLGLGRALPRSILWRAWPAPRRGSADRSRCRVQVIAEAVTAKASHSRQLGAGRRARPGAKRAVGVHRGDQRRHEAVASADRVDDLDDRRAEAASRSPSR